MNKRYISTWLVGLIFVVLLSLMVACIASPESTTSLEAAEEDVAASTEDSGNSVQAETVAETQVAPADGEASEVAEVAEVEEAALEAQPVLVVLHSDT